MPVLDKAFFVGSGNPDTRVTATAEVSNTGDSLTAALEALGCPEAAIMGCVVLHLTADNTRVANGEFCLVGVIEINEIRIACSKLWPNAAKGTTLFVTLPAASAFKFADGGLASDFLPQEEIEFYFAETSDARAPRRLNAEELRTRSVGEFCARIVAQLVKSDLATGVKLSITVLFFPASAQETLDTADAAREAGWPGLLITETECLLGPKATSAWGCPIVPLLRTGARLAENPRAPTGDELRRAVAAIMGRSNKPECFKTAGSLGNKVARYLDHPEEFSSRSSTYSWPKHSAALEKGRSVYLSMQI